MRGEEEDDPGRSARQPAEVLAAWIRDQLEDVRRVQLRRLEALRARLAEGAFEWDATPLAQAISALHGAGRELHFAPLRQGWLARRFGRHRAAYSHFIAVHERVMDCASRLKSCIAALLPAHEGRLGDARRILTELDIERRALEASVDRGVTWLQDMCTQLAAAGADDDAQVALADAAQRFTRDFKHLQGLDAVAQDLAVRGHSILVRRAALVEQVRAAGDAFDRQWMPRLAALVASLEAQRGAAKHVTAAFAAHDELMKRLASAADACGALLHEEHLFAQHLVVLSEGARPPGDDA